MMIIEKYKPTKKRAYVVKKTPIKGYDNGGAGIRKS
jgi:hypothetical protein